MAKKECTLFAASWLVLPAAEEQKLFQSWADELSDNVLKYWTLCSMVWYNGGCYRLKYGTSDFYNFFLLFWFFSQYQDLFQSYWKFADLPERFFWWIISLWRALIVRGSYNVENNFEVFSTVVSALSRFFHYIVRAQRYSQPLLYALLLYSLLDFRIHHGSWY